MLPETRCCQGTICLSTLCHTDGGNPGLLQLQACQLSKSPHPALPWLPCLKHTAVLLGSLARHLKMQPRECVTWQCCCWFSFPLPVVTHAISFPAPPLLRTVHHLPLCPRALGTKLAALGGCSWGTECRWLGGDWRWGVVMEGQRYGVWKGTLLEMGLLWAEGNTIVGRCVEGTDGCRGGCCDNRRRFWERPQPPRAHGGGGGSAQGGGGGTAPGRGWERRGAVRGEEEAVLAATRALRGASSAGAERCGWRWPCPAGR